MQIDLDLLFTWGAIAKEYKKNEIIFHEEESANFYYQIPSTKTKCIFVKQLILPNLIETNIYV